MQDLPAVVQAVGVGVGDGSGAGRIAAGRLLLLVRGEIMVRVVGAGDFGYGEGEEWAKTKAYFEKAWPAVLASLEKRFAKP